MALPTTVVVKEVGPRDGLQNEAMFMPTADKVTFINRLSEAGFQYIEVSSFVNPKWIPALADAVEVFQQIDRHPGVQYSALVPNEMGLERAMEAGVDAVNVFGQ
jgi:hydroxymethylglutaryl-CoA lyase